MTDPTDLDELASAYLDGEVTDDERARVEADPELMARVERLREVAALVRGGIEPQAGTTAAMQRRRAVLTAEDADPAGPVPPPVQVGRRSTWLPSPALAAAIVVVLALVGLVLLAAGRGGGDSDDAASSGGGRVAEDSGGGSGGGGGEGAASTTGSAGDQSSGGAGSPEIEAVPDLGSFATKAELSAELQQVSVTDLAPTAAADGAGTAEAKVDVERREIVRCETNVVGQGDLGEPLAIARAELAGAPLLVFSNPVQPAQGETTTAAATQLTVLDATDCRILFAILR